MDGFDLTSKKAAHRLGISPKTLPQAARRDALPPASATHGGRLHFHATDIVTCGRRLACPHAQAGAIREGSAGR